MGVENWFSVKGAQAVFDGCKNIFSKVYDRAAYPQETREKKKAEALQAYAKARRQTAVAEKEEVELLREKAVLLEEFGMPRDKILYLLEHKLEVFCELAKAREELQRQIEMGSILRIELKSEDDKMN